MYKNGGGVLIAAKKLLPAVFVMFAEPVSVEFVGVMIKPNNVSLPCRPCIFVFNLNIDIIATFSWTQIQ